MNSNLSACSVFTSPRVRGEVAARSRSERVAGEGLLLPIQISQMAPLTRLGPPDLATLSPQAGRGKKGGV